MSFKFDQFLEFCESNLTSSKEILKLVKKRYNECKAEYKDSESFSDLILVTESKIASDKQRIFVHLRDFLQTLKENRDSCINSNKRHLQVSSSEAESDTNLSKRRRTNKYTSDNLRCQSSQIHSENQDDTTQHKDVNIIKTSTAENGEDSNSSEVYNDTLSYSHGRPFHVKQSTSKQELKSGEDCSENESYIAVPLKTCSKMYSSSEEENDKDILTTKNIADIIQREDDDVALEDNLGNTDTDFPNKISDSEETKCFTNPESISSNEDHFIDSPKDTTENGDKTTLLDQRKRVASNVDCGSSEGDIKAETDEEDNESDSSLEFCSINLKAPIDKSKLNKMNSCPENIHSNILHNQSKLTEKERSFVKTNSPTNFHEEESEEIQMIVSDNDSEDNDTKLNSLVLDKTDDFTSVNGVTNEEDYAGYDADKENEKVTDRRIVTSSDEEDPEYAVKARKFREKCKKKYVVSTGGKKHGQSAHSHHNASTISKKEKSEKSPNKNKNKKKSPKKTSPSKSPIIIVTDSETNSEFENSTKSVKKRTDEKIVNKFKNEFNINVDNPEILVDKVSIQDVSNIDDKNDYKDDVDNMTSCESDTDKVTTAHSGNLVDGNLECEIDSENKTFERTKNGDSDIIVKKRVGFITEARYEKQGDVVNKDSDSEILKANGTESTFGNTIRDKSSDSEDNMGRRDNDTEQPGSSSCENDAKKTKASNKQIRKLEQLLEKIRDEIEDVRSRELGVDELDSEISDYMLEDKLQRKFMKVWDKLCELHQAVKTTGRPTDKYFRYQGTRYPDINRKVEKFINKRKKMFPDYHDIRNIVVKVNKDRRLHLRTREIDDISKEAFTDVGNQLQKRRQNDFKSIFQAPGAAVHAFSVYDDPALYDPDLKKKLDSNKKEAKNKMDKVVEKYAQLQYQVNDKTDDDDNEEDEEDEENADPNTETEDIDQLISGVDNSDSDINGVDNDDHQFDDNNGLDYIHESSPCLEIENLENGRKSAYGPNIPLHRIGQQKSVVDQVKDHSNPKSKHFAEQLGLGFKKKDTGITILSDNDDDNEVKFDGNTSELENAESDIEDEREETCEKSKTREVVTIITDDEEEEEGNATSADVPLELKITYARHVSLDDLDKIHKEGISSDSEEPLNETRSDDENVLADHTESVDEPIIESLSDIEIGDTYEHAESPAMEVDTEPSSDTHGVKFGTDTTKTEELDNFKNSDLSQNLTAKQFESDEEVICLENTECDSKATSTSGHTQAKCASDTSPPTSEIVLLDSEDSISPCKRSVSKHYDNRKSSHSDALCIDRSTEKNEEEDGKDSSVLLGDSDVEDDGSDNVMVAPLYKYSSVENCAVPDGSKAVDDGEHVHGELAEDMVNGGSASLSDIFESDDGESKDECEENEICENGEVLEKCVEDELSYTSDDIEEETDEANDTLINTSSCDLESIANLNIKLPNVKNKLLKLGTAVTLHPPGKCAQDNSSQEDSHEINSSVLSSPQWNAYDENAGLIETYQEPDISANLTKIQDDVIVLSDSE